MQEQEPSASPCSKPFSDTRSPKVAFQCSPDTEDRQSQDKQTNEFQTARSNLCGDKKPHDEDSHKTLEKLNNKLEINAISFTDRVIDNQNLNAKSFDSKRAGHILSLLIANESQKHDKVISNHSSIPYVAPIPVKLKADGISITYQAPPLPSALHSNIQSSNNELSNTRQNFEVKKQMLNAESNRSKEVLIPEDVDISPQIMFEQPDVPIKREKLSIPVYDHSLNGHEVPKYLPLLSSIGCKEEYEFEDIREEDEDAEDGYDDDDYPSSWDDVDSIMLMSPRVRSQNAWSDVGVPMTDSSIDFFQEKERLKLRQNNPKLSQPNVNSHNKYASDSNINDALIMMEPGLRKMAKDGYYTTTNSSFGTDSSPTSEDHSRSATNSGGASNLEITDKSVTFKVNVKGKDHIYHCIDDMENSLNHFNDDAFNTENFYEIPIERELDMKYSEVQTMKDHITYHDRKCKSREDVDPDSGFYSYIVSYDTAPSKKVYPLGLVHSPYDRSCYRDMDSVADRKYSKDTGSQATYNHHRFLTNSVEQSSKEEHVTRIPINQTESKWSTSQEQSFDSNNFAINCFDSEMSNVTVNGVCFSQPLQNVSNLEEKFASDDEEKAIPIKTKNLFEKIGTSGLDSHIDLDNRNANNMTVRTDFFTLLAQNSSPN